MGRFPYFPDADNYLAPFLDKDNTLGSPYANKELRGVLIQESRREVDRLTASKSIEGIQNIVAEDVPLLPLWQHVSAALGPDAGKQFVAVWNDITGAERALNSSATLQLWELGNGAGS